MSTQHTNVTGSHRPLADGPPAGQTPPMPWRYWIHFEFLTSPPGEGTCQVRRTHKIRSGGDLLSLTNLIATHTARPVRVIAHTLLSSAAPAAGPGGQR